jgi:hypothetical protein
LYLLYLDEAGDDGTWMGDASGSQPAIAIVALMLESSKLRDITIDFLNLKRRFFPGKFDQPHLLDSILKEVKGSDLRAKIRNRGERAKTQLHFLDEVFDLLEKYDASLVATLWPKKLGEPVDGNALYTTAVQRLSGKFQGFLAAHDDYGVVIADSRIPKLNSSVAHSVFTQKFKSDRDAFQRVVEAPLFGHSDTHAMIQITDLLASAILWPILTQAFMANEPSRLIRKRDRLIWIRYAKRLRGISGLKAGWQTAIYVHGWGYSKRVFFPLDEHDHSVSEAFFDDESEV